MRLLVLGGTAWLGRYIAATAVERGHHVTCPARGESGVLPPARPSRARTATVPAPTARSAASSGMW